MSSGRCGSTLLSSMLRMHPEILSISELFSMLGGSHVLDGGVLPAAAFWRRLEVLDEDMRSLLPQVLVPEVLADVSAPEQLSPLELVTLPHLSPEPRLLLSQLRAHVLARPAATPREHFGDMFDWMCRRLRRGVWVERSGGSLEYAARLSALWPTAKLVCVVRDGRDVACSMANHPMFRVRVARLVAKNPALPVAECLRSALPLHRFGAYWSAVMMSAQRVLRARAQGELMVLWYEQLARTPGHELDRLAQFITGAPAPADWQASAAQLVRVVPSRWRDLPRVERDELDAACRPGLRCMRALGVQCALQETARD